MGASVRTVIRQEWSLDVFADPIRQGVGIYVRQVWPSGVLVDPIRQGEGFRTQNMREVYTPSSHRIVSVSVNENPNRLEVYCVDA